MVGLAALCALFLHSSCEGLGLRVTTGGGSSGAKVSATSASSASLVTIAALRAEIALLKLDVRRLSCAAHGVGPTGGFCLEGTDGNVGGNGEISRGYASVLANIFKGTNVVDLGAGLGQYEKYWAEGGHSQDLADPASRPASVRACDGAANI